MIRRSLAVSPPSKTLIPSPKTRRSEEPYLLPLTRISAPQSGWHRKVRCKNDFTISWVRKVSATEERKILFELIARIRRHRGLLLDPNHLIARNVRRSNDELNSVSQLSDLVNDFLGCVLRYDIHNNQTQCTTDFHQLRHQA